MALIHPELVFLLDSLVPTPLAPFAADAMSLIAAEPEPERPFEKVDSRRRDPEEVQQVLRQLHLIEQAVFYRIKAERGLGARIAELGKALNLHSVAVLPAEVNGEPVSDGRLDQLMSTARQEAVGRFADVYWKALMSVRGRWESRQ